MSRATPAWRPFPHTADLGLFVYGRTRSELFHHAAQALVVHLYANHAQPRLTESLELRADSVEELLVGFLSELKWRFESRGFVLAGLLVRLNRDGRGLKATLCGECLPKDKIRYRLEMKNITYHLLKLERHAPTGGWRTRLVIDL